MPELGRHGAAAQQLEAAATGCRSLTTRDLLGHGPWLRCRGREPRRGQACLVQGLPWPARAVSKLKQRVQKFQAAVVEVSHQLSTSEHIAAEERECAQQDLERLRVDLKRADEDLREQACQSLKLQSEMEASTVAAARASTEAFREVMEFKLELDTFRQSSAHGSGQDSAQEVRAREEISELRRALHQQESAAGERAERAESALASARGQNSDSARECRQLQETFSAEVVRMQSALSDSDAAVAFERRKVMELSEELDEMSSASRQEATRMQQEADQARTLAANSEQQCKSQAAAAHLEVSELRQQLRRREAAVEEARAGWASERAEASRLAREFQRLQGAEASPLHTTEPAVETEASLPSAGLPSHQYAADAAHPVLLRPQAKLEQEGGEMSRVAPSPSGLAGEDGQSAPPAVVEEAPRAGMPQLHQHYGQIQRASEDLQTIIKTARDEKQALEQQVRSLREEADSKMDPFSDRSPSPASTILKMQASHRSRRWATAHRHASPTYTSGTSKDGRLWAWVCDTAPPFPTSSGHQRSANCTREAARCRRGPRAGG
mmetsp:Transcript_103964/g.303488  ORF Transcript_103964/g.303488 Transcript_103964/m.303488 type:complete len:554 (-) Transcript_103964:181-1842(-)